jgi:acyl-CoA dehydrogenase
VHWAIRDALFAAQNAIEGAISNFPHRFIAALMRVVVFPLGRPHVVPSDRLGQHVARLLIEPSATRDRLTAGMYYPTGEEATAVLEQAFLATVACEPLDRKLREGQRRGIVDPNIILTPEELTQWQRKEALRKQVIKVDDFPQDFGRAELVLEEKSTVAAKAA